MGKKKIKKQGKKGKNWKKFWKYTIGCPFVLVITGMLLGHPNPSWYWAIPLITVIWPFLMLGQARIDWEILQKYNSIFS